MCKELRDMRNHRNRKICPICKGRGRISKVKMTSNGTICEFEVCYHCKGTGRVESMIWSRMKLLWER